MDLQIKLFNGLGRGNHVIVISRGLVDIDGFKEIFRNVANTTEFLLDCMILIDLQDATCRLEPHRYLRLCGKSKAGVLARH